MTEMERAYDAFLGVIHEWRDAMAAHPNDDVPPRIMEADDTAVNRIDAAPITNERDALLACAVAAEILGELAAREGSADVTTRLFLKAFKAANIPMPIYEPSKIERIA